MATSSKFAGSVFINCPFDSNYQSLFFALTFAVIDCGFYARSALEIEDGGEVRISKIERIIDECKFGIHDISRTELDETHQLPRFNMPFELGLFLGAKRFGNKQQKEKKCLILDREEYRFAKYISDIAGQDIKGHEDKEDLIIDRVSAFLRRASDRKTVPGGNAIIARYIAFKEVLPDVLVAAELEKGEMGFSEFSAFAFEWLDNQLG